MKSIPLIVLVLLSALSCPAASGHGGLPLGSPFRPLFEQRADPHLVLQEDGWYTFMATVPEYDRLELRRARSLSDLVSAPPRVIWRRHQQGAMGVHIWAPELHRIDGSWFVYFAAGDTNDPFRIRTYVLENPARNPLEGEWIERGQFDTGWDSFSLDATTFVHQGRRYFCWAQHDPAIEGNTNIYLSEMAGPLRLKGRTILLSRPELSWEKVRFSVNEAPAFLHRNGRVFISYSASGTGPEYCVGLLSAPEDADLLDPLSWTKHPEPVLKTDEKAGIFGPGHNTFTTTLDRRTDIMVYHARGVRELVADPLYDPNRHARVQLLRWKPDGMPDFRLPD